MTRVLNEPLKIFPRLLGPRVTPGPMTSRGNSRTAASDISMGNLLLLRRDIVDGITARLRQWKSTQSSCEKDSRPKKSSRCIEGHQQSTGSCGRETIKRCSDGHRTPAESQPGSCADLLGHREYYQSIESSCPIHSRKPAQYNDWRACDSRECPQRMSSGVDDTKRVIFSKRWANGKPAREAHRQCRPKQCSSPRRCEREEEKCHPSHAPPDCGTEESEDVEGDEPMRPEAACVSQQCPESDGKQVAGAEDGVERPISDPYEHQTKPDPPPPRQPHWTENPPTYCEHCPRKTCKSTVKPSPMMFVPYRRPRKCRTADVDSSCASKNERIQTDAKTKVTCPPEISPRKCASPVDKCAGSRTPVGEPKLERFPTLTKSGDCRSEKSEREFVVSNVSDCKPNVESLKYRLSKCPSMKEIPITMPIADCESPVDKARRKRRTPSSCSEKTRRPTAWPDITRSGRQGEKIAPRNGWARQRYKVRLRIFQKKNGQLDPCLPPIIEVRQPPCGGQTRSSKLFVEDESELSPPRPARPSNYCPPKRPVVEKKSYATKMDECRAARNKDPRKCTRKKRR